LLHDPQPPFPEKVLRFCFRASTLWNFTFACFTETWPASPYSVRLGHWDTHGVPPSFPLSVFLFAQGIFSEICLFRFHPVYTGSHPHVGIGPGHGPVLLFLSQGPASTLTPLCFPPPRAVALRVVFEKRFTVRLGAEDSRRRSSPAFHADPRL